MYKYLTAVFVCAALLSRAVGETFSPPASPCATLNFNPGWKFFKGDVTPQGWAERVDFDDSKWTDVSAPHTFNDADSCQHITRDTADWEVCVTILMREIEMRPAPAFSLIQH